ncbi:MAG: substrate-binding domain-containing protein [Planctomycetota bacterium]|nr:substrate-binding domain-containing protein [Planctomycetota bacterium]
MNRLAMVALMAAAALAGCTSDSQPGSSAARPRIALIYKATTNPFFQAMEQGARAKAKEMNVDLDVAGIESETDADRQADLVRSMLGRKVQAMIIAPASSVGIVTPLLRVQQAGVPIVNIDNRINKEEAAKQGLKVATFIGPDNFEGARNVGAYACDIVKKKLAAGQTGKVLILRGIDGVENAEARRAGFEAAVKEAGCQVAGSQSANWQTEDAQKVTAAMLAATPEVHAILCANDKMALGAIAAVKARGKTREILIVGYDNIDLARKAMEQGEMHATVEQNPAMMGALGVECALKALNGATLPEVTPVPTQLITPEMVVDAKAGAPK